MDGDLINIAKEKIEILEKFYYQKYSTYDGIVKIIFDNINVNVSCIDLSYGYRTTYKFSFPIEWLSKSNNEIEKIAIEEKNISEENFKKMQREKSFLEEQEMNKKLEDLKNKFNNR